MAAEIVGVAATEHATRGDMATRWRRGGGGQRQGSGVDRCIRPWAKQDGGRRTRRTAAAHGAAGAASGGGAHGMRHSRTFAACSNMLTIKRGGRTTHNCGRRVLNNVAGENANACCARKVVAASATRTRAAPANGGSRQKRRHNGISWRRDVRVATSWIPVFPIAGETR